MGVSADKAEVQLRFIDKFGLQSPMLPDPDHAIIDAWGAREVLGVAAKRRTFLVGPDRTVLRVWPAVKVEGHAEEVLSAVREAAQGV